LAEKYFSFSNSVGSEKNSIFNSTQGIRKVYEEKFTSLVDEFAREIFSNPKIFNRSTLQDVPGENFDESNQKTNSRDQNSYRDTGKLSEDDFLQRVEQELANSPMASPLRPAPEEKNLNFLTPNNARANPKPNHISFGDLNSLPVYESNANENIDNFDNSPIIEIPITDTKSQSTLSAYQKKTSENADGYYEMTPLPSRRLKAKSEKSKPRAARPTKARRVIEKIVENIIQIPVEKLVEQIREVIVEKIIEIPKEIIEERVTEIRVDRIKEVPVIREKIKLVEKIVEVTKRVIKYVPKRIEIEKLVEIDPGVPEPIVRIVEREVVVERPVVREVVREVEVVREIQKEVEKIVERIVEVKREVPVFVYKKVFKEVEVVVYKEVPVKVPKVSKLLAPPFGGSPRQMASAISFGGPGPVIAPVWVESLALVDAATETLAPVDAATETPDIEYLRQLKTPRASIDLRSGLIM
jgi:hypothetical protein